MKRKYVIVRTYSMGVYAGDLNPDESTETIKVMNNARLIYYWDGAATLAQLAEDGPQAPQNCKFTQEVARVELTSPQGFAVFDVSDKAREVISAVKPWKK